MQIDGPKEAQKMMESVKQTSLGGGMTNTPQVVRRMSRSGPWWVEKGVDKDPFNMASSPLEVVHWDGCLASRVLRCISKLSGYLPWSTRPC